MTDADGGKPEDDREPNGVAEASPDDGDSPAESHRADGPGDDVGDAFAIPRRPERRYPHSGGVEYDGETVFVLTPEPPQGTEPLREALEDVLETDAYTYGDWFDLPMPLYLVHDERTGDVFRVSIRDGKVRFHVLPATESAGLEALYEALTANSDLDWSVECRVDG